MPRRLTPTATHGLVTLERRGLLQSRGAGRPVDSVATDALGQAWAEARGTPALTDIDRRIQKVIHQEQPARPRCGCWTATWFAGIFPHTGTGLPSDSHRHGAFAAIASQVTRER